MLQMPSGTSVSFPGQRGPRFLFVSPERAETDGYLEYLLRKNRESVTMVAYREVAMIRSNNKELDKYSLVRKPEHVKRVWKDVESSLPKYWDGHRRILRSPDSSGVLAPNLGILVCSRVLLGWVGAGSKPGGQPGTWKLALNRRHEPFGADRGVEGRLE